MGPTWADPEAVTGRGFHFEIRSLRGLSGGEAPMVICSREPSEDRAEWEAQRGGSCHPETCATGVAGNFISSGELRGVFWMNDPWA